MHCRRQVDNLLDEIIEENKRLNNKEESKENKMLAKAQLQQIKDKINTLTLDGERAIGLWTESPEFIYKNITSN